MLVVSSKEFREPTEQTTIEGRNLWVDINPGLKRRNLFVAAFNASTDLDPICDAGGFSSRQRFAILKWHRETLFIS